MDAYEGMRLSFGAPPRDVRPLETVCELVHLIPVGKALGCLNNQAYSFTSYTPPINTCGVVRLSSSAPPNMYVCLLMVYDMSCI